MSYWESCGLENLEKLGTYCGGCPEDSWRFDCCWESTLVWNLEGLAWNWRASWSSEEIRSFRVRDPSLVNTWVCCVGCCARGT